LLNGRIATFWTRLKMCQLIFQHQLKNQRLVTFRIWDKSNWRSWFEVFLQR
jgi:hypothetical protein